MPELTWTGDFWEASKNIPFLDREVKITFITGGEANQPTKKQLNVLGRIEDLPKDFSSILDDAADSYRKTVIESLLEEDSEPIRHIQRENISNHYKIDDVVIPELGRSRDVLFFLTGECDWEEEHGIEILVKNEKVESCGMQDVLYLNEAWQKYIS
ncbi:hypothetical protein HY405_00470 [Candidatus Microgenomates bacterium]|nr:hypothetical protein [Candidatus Microgenomates bacterium]